MNNNNQMPTRSSFTTDFVSLNYPDQRESFRWCFLPGMLFQDNMSWWKNARRPRFHEGADFCRFYCRNFSTMQVEEGDLVPILFDGVVLKVENDFLASTIWMRHEKIRQGNMVLFSALAHVVPLDGVIAGTAFKQGKAVAAIGRRRDLLEVSMHLHVSVFWAPHYFKTARLGWPTLPTMKEISLVDPLQVISDGF